VITTLPDGRVFPVYEGQPLSWSIGLYMTPNEQHLGYPRSKAVVNAMRVHRPDQLERERRDSVRASFGMFRGNAATLLRLIDTVALPPPPY
jgi:hypothetical protein